MRRTPRVGYKHGLHICTLFSSREEQVSAAVEFIQAGLARGEQCGYACCEQTPEEFREELRRAGVDTEAEEARGALTLVPKDEGHLQGGCFDAARTIERAEAALSNALNAGYTGLC